MSDKDLLPRILIVDDTHENMEIIGRLLETEGYDLYLADNGYSAIELSEKFDFDLILMDVMMPNLDGFETFLKIKNIRKDSIPPVIFLTAKVDVESIIMGFEIGGADYVKKPFNGLELKARVKYQLELRRMRKEIEIKNRFLEEANAQLKEYATLDPLTKLYNRREVMERIQYEANRFERTEKAFSVIIADIDFFKQVNDTYGHQFGDFVLQKLSDLFLQTLRKQDSAARWGGEEFLMLLPDTEADGAFVLAETLRKKIMKMLFEKDENHVNITMTFGVSTFTDKESIEEVINKADQALYEGKASGRNQTRIWEPKE